MSGLLLACNPQKKVQNKANKAFEYYSKGKKYQSAVLFEELGYDYPDSELRPKNIYNAATIYNEVDSLNDALRVYKAFLKFDVNDADKDSSRGAWETRANYRHYSARKIAEIYFAKKEFKNSIEYLDKAKYDFPYQSDSVRSLRREALLIDDLKAKNLYNLGQKEEAICLMFPHAFTESPWSSHPAKELLIEWFEKDFDLKEALRKVKNAIESCNVNHTHFELAFFGRKVIVVPAEVEMEGLDLEYLFNSSFYRELYLKSYR